MNFANTIDNPKITGTSALGSIRDNPDEAEILLQSYKLLNSITSSTESIFHWELIYSRTTAGYSEPNTEANKNPLDTRKAIHEIKKISGLTWDQLAQLFNVSRRSLHFWASGKQLSSSNEEDLYRLVEVFRYINRGNADINRQVLISAQENGQIPFALLGEKKYEETKKLLGQGLGKPKPQLQPLSKEASLLRTPPPPDELVGATNEPVHQEVGKTRKAKSVRQKTSGAKKY